MANAGSSFVGALHIVETKSEDITASAASIMQFLAPVWLI